MMVKKLIKNRVTAIRIPKEWHAELYQIAEEECRTLNSVANQAIKEFLKRRKEGEK
jgi:predicted transcriptional regulator